MGEVVTASGVAERVCLNLVKEYFEEKYSVLLVAQQILKVFGLFAFQNYYFITLGLSV